MRIGWASWLAALVVPPPPSFEDHATAAVTVVQKIVATTSPGILDSKTISPSSVALSEGVSLWLAAEQQPPSKSDIQLLRQAFAEFYGVERDLIKSEALLSQTIAAWENQPPDERAGLYRVRGDCYTLLGDATKAAADYDLAVKLFQGPGGDKADPGELPLALLGRARALKSKGNAMSRQDAIQAASDYELSLKLSSREEWDTDQELLEDGATRNPYAAWELGSVLRVTGKWKEAALAHTLAANAFDEIGDRARSVISLTDAGIDLAAAGGGGGETREAISVLQKAIPKTKGVEGRDVALLQRVIAKEGEGRMALAAILWNEGQRADAERVLGDACIRLEQLQSDAFQRAKTNADKLVPQDRVGLRFSIDDDIAALDMSCYRFKNKDFLAKLGWSEDLQTKVIKLETLR